MHHIEKKPTKPAEIGSMYETQLTFYLFLHLV